jgi:hypothetical protein
VEDTGCTVLSSLTRRHPFRHIEWAALDSAAARSTAPSLDPRRDQGAVMPTVKLIVNSELKENIGYVKITNTQNDKQSYQWGGHSNFAAIGETQSVDNGEYSVSFFYSDTLLPVDETVTVTSNTTRITLTLTSKGGVTVFTG